jgi:exonuclease III
VIVKNNENKGMNKEVSRNEIIINKELKIFNIMKKDSNYVDGYETDESTEELQLDSGVEGEIEIDMLEADLEEDSEDNLINQGNRDIYSGYGFDTEKVGRESEDLKMILASISKCDYKKKKKKNLRGGYRGKKGLLEKSESEEEMDVWEERLSEEEEAKRKYFLKKEAREAKSQAEAKKGRILLEDDLSDSDREILEAQINLVEGKGYSSSSEEDEADYENNLTYHEDSLSVMRGKIGGNDVWITTDTGAMTQLMQKDYAKKMGFVETTLPHRKRFNISAPGGGKEKIKTQVVVKVTLKMSEVFGAEEALNREDLEMEEEVVIPMSFGLVSDLPVPMLWGGGQMRQFRVHDLHEKKLLSFEMSDGKKYVTPSKSWLASCAEMKMEARGVTKKAVKGFLPSTERMVNMVMGGRTTTNVGAALYPGKDNIVRLARHNAKVDEGLNQVDLVNVEEVFADYGEMITVTSCVNNGEAYVVVRNNVDQTLSLPAGRLVIRVKPIISLPICRTATPEFQELKRRHEMRKEARAEAPNAEDGVEGADQESMAPRSSIVWSCRGLTERIKEGNLDGMFKYVKEFEPDMVTFQDVRWRCIPGDNTKILPEGEDFEYYKLFVKTLDSKYNIYLNLGTKQYGGQVTLIKSECFQPKVTFNFGETEGQYAHGRVTQMDYENFISYTVMAPFNGAGRRDLIERRVVWDKAIAAEMEKDPHKIKFVMGNFNAVMEDTDMSDAPEFWQAQGKKQREAAQVEEILDIGDEGFGGTTANERMRFHDWATKGDLRDASRKEGRTDGQREFTFRPGGRIRDKGLILDYALAPFVIIESGGVESSVVFKTLNDKDPWMGSNHRPKWFSLKKDWWERLEEYDKSMEIEDRRVEESNEDEAKEEALMTRYILSTMFRNNGNDLCPKCDYVEGTELELNRSLKMLHLKMERKEIEGERVRPEEFPEELWRLVDPGEQGFVQQRFEKFKDIQYRSECIKSILEDLDINNTEVQYWLNWKDGDKIEGREDQVMRAQALANMDIFFFVDKNTAELAKDVTAEINTTDEKAMRCRPRKLSVTQQAFLQAKTGLMERVGKLEESNSQWCHGVVLVAYEERIKAFMDRNGETAMTDMFKKEHEVEVATFFRLCIDLRMLNAKTIPDIFPLPRIDDLVESIPRKCGRYSISDICDAFFTCDLKKEDRHKTAFRTHDRHLQFAVLPQGFINSPSIFCRMIARTFKGMDRGKFSAYIDDVLNHTDDFEEHLETQQEMYDRLRENRLTLKVAKTHLNQTKVKFLGHILTKEGRLPDPKAVEAILEWKDPTTTKEVRSFLGATLYYREYIYQYADMAMPLYELIRKGVIVDKVWDPEKHGEAVKKIKMALTSKPVLMQVDNTKKFRLKVDACRVGRGIGCILEQQNDEDKWQPVSYYSSSLNKTERQYSATELECKALHDCIIHYAIYLKHIPHFEVFSDHCALKYMQNSDKASTNGRLMRYLMNLQGYNFTVLYRKGTENCDADAVSRLLRASDDPIFLTEDELRDESGVVSKQMLFKARKLEAQNKKMEKEVEKMMRKLAKIEMREMAELNDRILEEGVENLESETGRQRFYENLQKNGIESTKEVVDKTIEELRPRENNAQKEIENEGEEEILEVTCMANFINAVYKVDKVDDDYDVIDDSTGDIEMINMVHQKEEETQKEEKKEEKNENEEYKYQCSSEETVPYLFINMVEQVRKDNRKRSQLNGQRYNLEAYTRQRERMKKRVEEKSKEEILVSGKRMVNCFKKHNLRKQVRVDYLSEEKIQPNIFQMETKPKRSEINGELERKRRAGYKQCEVRDSLLGKSAGRGLFATKDLKGNREICSYEGPQVSREQLQIAYADRDYVAAAVRNVLTKEMVYIDSNQEDSCYGRYANDPIDELLVNAKIVWKEGRLIVVATDTIAKGEEILVSYQGNYWQARLGYLPAELQKRIRKTYPNEKNVGFEDSVAKISYSDKDSVRLGVKKGKEKVESVLLGSAASNRMTRLMENVLVDEGEEEKEDDEEDVFREEDFSHENVNQCEELAEKLRPILHDRKFIDNETGRLYEIYQVRYDVKSEIIIGFRRGLTGMSNNLDGSAYAVYGKEGLYELSERYLIDHPEDRINASWPTNQVEWAEQQMEDPDLLGIINRIRETGGSVIEHRGKFKLIPTGVKDRDVLFRIVNQDKGNLEQCVVPSGLQKLALKIHHEGFAHLGGSRMYATMRRRYFWQGMEKDCTLHVGDCINCKLRKAYQRKAKVPIMSYMKSKRALDRIHMDLTGPLPTTKDGNKYILVIKDYLTKYVWLIPLRNKTAEAVALAFVNDFVCQAGIPDMVVSDRGNEFVNIIMKKVASIMDIVRVSTTPYNPRSDGFVENHNRTLKDQLFNFVDNLKQDDWDNYLPIVQLMYNTTVSLTTGYSPMLLLTGREARMPSFEHVNSETPVMKKEMADNQYVMKLIESMKTYQEFAINQMGDLKDNVGARVRKPLEFVEYKVDQLFLRVRRPISVFHSANDEEEWKISMKLLERYEGPYRVIRKINPVLYDADIGGKEVRVHAVNMKPY